jgi:hypothetical protein
MRFPRILMAGLVLTLAGSSTALPQRRPMKVHFGVLGGAAFDKPGGADATDVNQTYAGFGVGGFVGLQLTPVFAIQPEALYVQKGAKGTVSDPGGTITGKIKVAYFEIPVLAKLRMPVKGADIVSPHVYAGPALAYKAGCHVNIAQGSFSASESCSAPDVEGRIKSTDFSVVLGGGVDIGRAIVDVRYGLGLTKISVDSSGTARDVKNRTLYLLVGWTFRTP